MGKEEYDYKRDLEIDRFYLDDICDTHAELYAKWAELYTDAVKERNDVKTLFEKRKAEAKDEINRVRSRLNLEIRKNYKQYGLDKVTDSIADSWIGTQEEYLASLENLREVIASGQEEVDSAEHRMDILKVAKDSFDHRKQMIQAEVNLYVAGYWAKPTQPKEYVQRKGDDASAEIGDKSAQTFRDRRRKALETTN